MEKLDIVIVGAVVVAGFWYFRDLSNRPPVQPNVAAPGSATPAAPATGAAPAAPPVEQPAAPVAANPRKDGILFRTPEHDVLLSSQGASVSEVTLTRIQESTYRAVQSGEDDDRKARPFRVLEPLADPRTPVRSFVVAPLVAPPANAAKELERASQVDWAHEELPGGKGHRFTLQLESGLRLVKTYSLPDAPAKPENGPEHPYHFDLTITIENRTGREQPLGYALAGPVGMVDQASDRSRAGQQVFTAARRGKKVEMLFSPALGLQEWTGVTAGAAGEQVGAFGLATKYFAVAIIPEAAPALTKAEANGLLAAFGATPTDRDKQEDGLGHQGLVIGHSPARMIGGGGYTETYRVYVGPKRKAIFEASAGPYANQGLDKLIDYGWFESLAVVMLGVLRFFHWIVGNWGVAIILLTFLVRGLLLPLSIWSQKNMLRMQKVAPELNKLKEKYSKKDGTMTPEQQRAFAQAQMDLFRTHGVNPVGCLGPIFLQIPVFVGLWNALNYSFDVREQPFVGWIHDLSVPEVLFRLPFTLPFLGTNAFSVLPLIMVACYYLQMKLQPTPTDPRAAEQQRMMMFMMPIFGLLMYTAPSGLMLYFITSAIWTMVESKWVKKHLERTEGPLPAVAVPVTP